MSTPDPRRLRAGPTARTPGPGRAPVQLSPDELDDELFHLDLLPDDPGPWTVEQDVEPRDEHDRLAERILRNDLTWALDLDDPYRWHPEAEPADA